MVTHGSISGQIIDGNYSNGWCCNLGNTMDKPEEAEHGMKKHAEDHARGQQSCFKYIIIRVSEICTGTTFL